MPKREALVVLVALVVGAICITAATAAEQAAAPGYKPAGGWGKTGTANGQFAANGGGIAVDKAGNVYVADSDNARVQVFTAKGGFLRKWGSQGTGDGQFGNPEDLAIAPDGTIWVADDPNSRYEQFSSTGAFQTTLTAPSGELARDVAVASDGSVIGAVEGSASAGFHVFAKTADGWDAPGPLIGPQPPLRADDIEVSPDGSIWLSRSPSQNGPLTDQIQHFSAEGKRLPGSIKLPVGDGTRGIGIDLDCNILAPNDVNGSGMVKYSPSGKKLASTTLPYIPRDIAVAPKGDVYVLIQAAGVVHLVEDHSTPGTALVPATIAVSGGVAKVKYTLAGVACPAQVAATATLTGKGISGKANVNVAAGKTTVLSIPVKAAKGKGAATFKIVLKTNGRPTTQARAVTVSVS